MGVGKFGSPSKYSHDNGYHKLSSDQLSGFEKIFEVNSEQSEEGKTKFVRFLYYVLTQNFISFY